MVSQRPPYDWIVFDASGTLMRPSPSPGEVYHRFAREHGSQLSVNTVRERFPRAFAQAFGAHQAPTEGLETNPQIERARWEAIVRLCIDDVDAVQFERLFQRLWDHFADPYSWQLFDTVAETIDRVLAQGVSVAVASNFDERLKGILAHRLPQVRPHLVFTSAEIGYAKPDPRFYRSIAEKLRIANPSRMLMIGDDVVNDVLASRAAGWHAEQVDWGQGLGFSALAAVSCCLQNAT